MIFKPYFGEYEILNLFRIGGAGLGNLLFPLSRAYIYSLKNKTDILPPIWPSVKLGPFLRGEKDKRSYINSFKSTFISRTTLQVKNIMNKTMTEDDYISGKVFSMLSNNVTVEVAGLRNYFDDLKGYNSELLKLFLNISSKKIKYQYQAFDTSVIGVHVRLGDYNESSRTPISWYKRTIISMQRFREFKNSKFILFSDGEDDELKELLQIPNCSRVMDSNALGDILRLSKCKIIIGSNSTFSAWASFLGKRPFIRHEKFYLNKIHQETDSIYEGDCIEEFLLK